MQSRISHARKASLHVLLIRSLSDPPLRSSLSELLNPATSHVKNSMKLRMTARLFLELASRPNLDWSSNARQNTQYMMTTRLRLNSPADLLICPKHKRIEEETHCASQPVMFNCQHRAAVQLLQHRATMQT